MLTNIGTSERIYDLRKKIQQHQRDLDQLNSKPVLDMPELVSATNVLRSNEYLSQINDKKTELLSVYSQYSQSLEELLVSVFAIQHDLKEILKEQSSLLSDQLVAESGPQSNTVSKRQPKSKPKQGPKTTSKPKQRPKTAPKPKQKSRVKRS